MSIFSFLTIVIIIVAILLISAILLQEPKERITPSGGGAASIQRIGINQKADFLEKATWILVGILLSLTLLSSIFLKDAQQLNGSPNLAKVQKDQMLNDSVLPNDKDNSPTQQQKDEQSESKETTCTSDK